MRDSRVLLLPATHKGALPIHVVGQSGLAALFRRLGQHVDRQARSLGFRAAAGSFIPFTDQSGALAGVLAGVPAQGQDPFQLGSLASKLPEGSYRFEGDGFDAKLAALAWCLELYRYDPYRAIEERACKLACPKGVDRDEVAAFANAVFLVRDLVNAPANLLGPAEIEVAARRVIKGTGAKITVTSGEKLRRGYPLVHAVGAAAARAPRLIDFTWGNARHPKVTLVGKGVCFDTGGLDIKPPANMLLMKKDMGGAATVLGLAQLIMGAKLPVRLRVLIPAVENSISGVAFRPGDVFKSRKGLTVEIGNTDAEGRLILADALALADEESPELMIDMATLTGAARVALGPDIPPFFTDDDRLADDLVKQGMLTNDPLWRLPLWRPYEQMIESPVASINNAGAGGFAGSITAALFLRKFVEKAKAYAHFDIFAWTPAPKPGRPKGGEAQAMRAIFALLQKRYG